MTDVPDAGAVADDAPEREEKLFQVVFDLPEESESWPPVLLERMWAAKTSVTMEVRIRNIPFYVRGVSFDDTVRVLIDHERRSLVFDRTVARSGHHTIRIVLMDGGARSDVEDLITRSGCSHEIDPGGVLWAIDVPPDVAYDEFLHGLVTIAEGGRLEIQEATRPGPSRAPGSRA